MKKCVKCRELIEQKVKIDEWIEGKKPQQQVLLLIPNLLFFKLGELPR